MKHHQYVKLFCWISVIVLCVVRTAGYGYHNNQIPGLGGGRRWRPSRPRPNINPSYNTYNPNNIYSPKYSTNEEPELISKDKVVNLGATLKRYVQDLRHTANQKVDIVF